MVAARGCERLGFARAGDYARERLGLSARSLQDLARVDALLEELPQLEAALVSGALSWTQVRLVARVATPADEARWVAYAGGLTARALSGEVRSIDREAACLSTPSTPETDEDGAPEEERAGLRIRVTPATRVKWSHVRQLAARVAGERLPPWQALEHVTAEVLSALPVEARPRGARCPKQVPLDLMRSTREARARPRVRRPSTR